MSNKKRFEDEYGPGEAEKPNLSKSLSYQKTFLGNNDDFFTLGVAFAKNSVKLYTDFYNSDLIVASPLGLRSVVGAPGKIFVSSHWVFPSLTFLISHDLCVARDVVNLTLGNMSYQSHADRKEQMVQNVWS